MPTPGKNEKKEDFIARCIPIVMDEGTAEDNKQGFAVCQSMWDQHHKKDSKKEASESRTIQATVQIAEIHTVQFEGRDHLVIPVVALVGDIVIRAHGSKGPEYVTSAVLERAPSGWNGRPVIMNHPPAVNGELVSANSPEGLESAAFGRMFHTRYEDGKLKTEAYIDPQRAEAVGAEALHALSRFNAGEVVEVSIGAIVNAERRDGIAPNGDRYEYIWHDIIPDHLAILSAGSVGACSVKAGCGALRAAQLTEIAMPNTEKGLIARIVSFLAGKDKGESDVELRGQLFNALHDSEPGFAGIVEVYPKSASVIYEVNVDGAFKMKRATYTMNEGTVSLNSDGTEVEMETSYVAVAAANGSTEEGSKEETVRAASCGCGGHDAGAVPVETEVKKEVIHMADINKELAGRLIALAGSPFKEEQRAALEAMPEDSLTSLLAKLDVKEVVVAAPVAPAQLTAAQFLELAPPEIREMVAAQKEARETEHSTLVAQLKGLQSVLNETQLKEKSLCDLRVLAQIASANAPVSYAGVFQPVERQASGSGQEYDRTADLNPYTKALDKRAGVN